MATQKKRITARKSKNEGDEIGARLKAIREAYGLSQRELAKRTGVTNGMISLIEQSQVSPSVASLKKLLDGFPLTLSEFFSYELKLQNRVFYRADELTEIADGKISFRQIGLHHEDRKLQMLHERYEPGGDTGKAMLSHPGEESGIVVSGEIEITVGNQTRILKAGDAYYFHSRVPHRFRNISKQPCEIISACTPPTF